MTHLLLSIVIAMMGAPAEGDRERAEEPRSEVAAQAMEFADAESLLDALERADANIRTFHSGITYDRRMMLQGDIQIRYGDLYFRAPKGGGNGLRTFGVHFDTLVFDEKAHEEQQAWVFDGEWLVEKRVREKQYTARQIAPPGAGIDPLRLGEGPLPIPIGQKTEDILARYEAELVAVEDGFDTEDEMTVGYLNYVRSLGAQQIVLTPREEMTGGDEFRRIRLWYAKNTEGVLLPVLSRTLDRKGDEVFVQLYEFEVNTALPAGVTAIEPPKNAESEGWDVQIERRIAREDEN